MKLVASSFAFLVYIGFCSAQMNIPILERRISIEFVDEKLPDVLMRIGREAKFSFSYNSSIISNSQMTTQNFSNKPIREILIIIFKGSIDYKEKSNHLILFKVNVKPRAAVIPVIISGYIENSITKERIANASVYDKKSVMSVVTDQYGFFKIKLDKKEKFASLTVSKRNFRDTLVTITASGNQFINISVTPIKNYSLMAKAQTSSDSIKNELSLPYNNEPNIDNIHDTLYSDIQISLLPFLGSNGALSANTINNFSINIFGGYSLGTRKIELGFFINLDRGDVSFLQFAGIGNLVGRNVYGLQASGFFNVNGGETKAVQLSGFGNVNFKGFQGVQVAGFGNVNLEAADGVMVAGFGNLSEAPSKGIQIAGFGNLQTDRFIGSQIAGVSNIAAKHISGSQISAIFNYGKSVRGTQIGLINITDTLGGVPIGLVSIVKTGYHKLEVSADEIFNTNIAFRTGVQKFYNIIFIGIKPENMVNSTNVWTFGYGMGSARRISSTLQLNIDLTSQHISKGDFTSQMSQLNKIHLGVDYKLRRKFSVYGGLTLNGYLTNSSYMDYPDLFSYYQPSVINDITYGSSTNLKMWLGAKVGLRFF